MNGPARRNQPQWRGQQGQGAYAEHRRRTSPGASRKSSGGVRDAFAQTAASV